VVWAICLLAFSIEVSHAKTLAHCGQGWLEEIDGYFVLHLKGTHYEMGYQHGTLLKQHVRENMAHMMKLMKEEHIYAWGPFHFTPYSTIRGIVEFQRKHVPQKYIQELAGLAEGSGLELQDLEVGNFIPELMHCSGFAVMNSATSEGKLYHGRVLDYATNWRLQEHAVLIVAEPTGGIPFVNVSYAGFIGSVTGMNSQQMSIGEMGGQGLGHWDGVPMALLVRQVLESADDLDDAIAIFRDQPRTCEYFYVIADGETNEAVALEASWNTFATIRPGQADVRLPRPIADAVILSAGDRYHRLVDRIEQLHGDITSAEAIGLMNCPVAMKSNLHNALFEPRSTSFWVANATHDRQPAAEQPYHAFNLKDLLARKP
jgi:predicted choloylglycine hydrolase